jgi:hypothetical protein
MEASMKQLRFFSLIYIVSIVLSGTSALAQNTSSPSVSGVDTGPQVRLETKDAQSHFLLGDLITLQLVFTHPGFIPPVQAQPLTPIQRARQAMHPAPGQHTVNPTDYDDLADSVSITPESGWFQWQGKSGHDYFTQELLTDHEIRVDLVLNQGYVFREQGHYEIKVTTWRLDGKQVTTNPVGLDLAARPADDERTLVRSLDAEIASHKTASDSCCCESRNTAAEHLAALPGEDAVRAKVRWLLSDGGDEEDIQNAMAGGLAASNNYDLQLQLLLSAWRDPRRVPDSEVLNAIENTRLFHSGKALPGWRMVVGSVPPDAVSRRLADERHADVQEIVDSLPRRSGQNLTDTAYFLMEGVGADAAQEAAVRPVAVEEFEHMDSMQQDMLLQNGWQKIREPRLIPVLRAMLDKPPAQNDDYRAALPRLIELDPASAKHYAVREICDPHSIVLMANMAALPDATLPETDACLMPQMVANASKNEPSGVTPWPEKAFIAARFASGAIYPQMLALYRAHPEWNDAVRGATIAYLVRWHPESAAELLPPSSLTRQTYVLYAFDNVLKARHASYPESLRQALRAQLTHGSDKEAEWALSFLSEFGGQQDAAVAIARLDRLVADWTGREAELVSPTPAPAALDAFQLRQALVLRLWSKEGAWVLPVEERQRIKRLCLGTACAQWSWDGERQPESR